ncbi:MAG: TetR/AcrR family transcriptional regulator [Betaproteobacteria bacterium]|nr:MAG: TetR/AcrR family transcriptional regulator [Betaproteobacteria bacterium]
MSFVGGRGKWWKIKAVPGVWCLVSGVRWLGLRPWEPDTRHQTPCHTDIRRIASDFEQSFETMRPYDERLDHLLARAARVFADKGYHPTTMRDLAAASGMSLAGMYYYVRGKEDLLALIQERCFTRHHVEFFANHMAEMKVLSHEASPRGVSAIKRRYVDLLESVLKDAAPEQGAVDRSAATYILFGMMNWIYNWYDPAGEIDPARLADLMASIFLGGFVETHQEAK